MIWKPPLWQATKGRKNKLRAFAHPSGTRFIFAWIYVHLSSHKCQVYMDVYMFIVTFVWFFTLQQEIPPVSEEILKWVFSKFYKREHLLSDVKMFLMTGCRLGTFFGCPESSALGVSAFSRLLCHSRPWHGLNIFPRFVPLLRLAWAMHFPAFCTSID